MIIFLTGLPGAGKSSVGKALAEALNWQFLDMDEDLSERLKEKIKKGELLSETDIDEWVLNTSFPRITLFAKQRDLVVAGIFGGKKYTTRAQNLFTDAIFVNLTAPYEVLLARVTSRDHIAGKKSLDLSWEAKDKLMAPGPVIDSIGSVAETVQKCLALKTLLNK